MGNLYANLFSAFRNTVARDFQRQSRAISLMGNLVKYFLSATGALLLIAGLFTYWPTYLTGLAGPVPPAFAILLSELFAFPLLFGNSFTLWRQRLVGAPVSGQTFVAALRGAIVARDEVIAPAANDGAILSSRESAPPDDETVAPIAHPLRFAGGAAALTPVAVPVGMAGFVVCALVLLQAFDLIKQDASSPFWVLAMVFLATIMGVAAACLIASIWAFNAWIQRRRAKRTLAAHMTADGVSMAAVGRGASVQSIAWRDALGFARFHYQDGLSRTHTIYLLSSDTDDLLWVEPPVNRYDSPKRRARDAALHDAARRLAQVTAQRTGLPLLDVTAIIRASQEVAFGIVPSAASLFDSALSIARSVGDETLATTLWRGTHPGAGEPPQEAISKVSASTVFMSTTPSQRDNVVRDALALLPYVPPAEQNPADAPHRLRRERASRIHSWETALAGGVLLATLVVAGACWGIQKWYMPGLLHSVSTQINAQTPLYIAPLDTPQADWPTRAPAGAETRSARFTTHGYELATTDPNQVEGVWTPALAISEGAVQVTVALPNVSPDSTDTAGLLFNTSADGSRAVAFTISSFDGEVSVSRCHDLNTPQGACDDSVMNDFRSDRAVTSTRLTTLLMLHRGQMYLFYVNGAPAFIYRDTTGYLGASGYAGVYLGSGGTSADFTNFTIYPAPDTLPFWLR